jgi:serine protease inhibitor
LDCVRQCDVSITLKKIDIYLSLKLFKGSFIHNPKKKNNNKVILIEKESRVMDISMNMTQHLFTKPEFQNQNIVFSPLSLFTVLSIIAIGSEGPTQQQLLSFLQANSTDHLNSVSSQLISSTFSDASRFGGPSLSFVNGVWVERSLSLQPSFKKSVTTYYNATLASVDFKTKVWISPCLSYIRSLHGFFHS